MISSSARDHFPIATIAPQRVLYYFDEPLIFVAGSGSLQVLCSKVDENDGRSQFLVVPILDATVRALEQGRLSVRAAFDTPSAWVLEADSEWEVVNAGEFLPDDLGEDMYPAPGFGLYAHHGRVEDRFTNDVDPAFLSFKFSGPNLSRSGLSFSLFRQLVDQTYSAARDLFLGGLSDLDDTVTDALAARMLDIPLVRAPAFASLRLDLGQPALLQRKVKTNVSVDHDAVAEQLRLAGSKFMDEASEVANLAATDNFKPGQLAHRTDLLDILAALLPSERSAISSLELSSSIDGIKKSSITFDQVAGERLINAYNELQYGRRTLSGKVTGQNDKRLTFLLTTSSGREVTCHVYDAGIFSALMDYHARARQQRLSRTLRVVGDFAKRTRRDYMAVDRIVLPDGTILS